jgi:hypothetical protein
MIGCRAVTIGQGRSLPGGDGRPRSTRQSAARTSFALGDAPSARSRDSRWESWRGGGAGVDTHKGGLGGGGVPGVRYTSPFALAGGRIGAATSCASAQLQHPRQVESPSRRPIWPKRAAVSPRSARSPRKSGDPGVLERGAKWHPQYDETCHCRRSPRPSPDLSTSRFEPSAVIPYVDARGDQSTRNLKLEPQLRGVRAAPSCEYFRPDWRTLSRAGGE